MLAKGIAHARQRAARVGLKILVNCTPKRIYEAKPIRHTDRWIPRFGLAAAIATTGATLHLADESTDIRKEASSIHNKYKKEIRRGTDYYLAYFYANLNPISMLLWTSFIKSMNPELPSLKSLLSNKTTTTNIIRANLRYGTPYFSFYALAMAGGDYISTHLIQEQHGDNFVLSLLLVGSAASLLEILSLPSFNQYTRAVSQALGVALKPKATIGAFVLCGWLANTLRNGSQLGGKDIFQQHIDIFSAIVLATVCTNCILNPVTLIYNSLITKGTLTRAALIEITRKPLLGALARSRLKLFIFPIAGLIKELEPTEAIFSRINQNQESTSFRP